MGRNAPVSPCALQRKLTPTALAGWRGRLAAAFLAEFFEQLDLDLLDFEKPVVLAAEQVIEFFVKMPDFEFGLEIDLIIVFAAQSVAGFAPVLAHHDDGGL